MASAPLERSGMAAANPRAVAPAPGARFALIGWRDCEDALTLAEWDELAQSVSEPNPFCESWNLLPALGGFARDSFAAAYPETPHILRHYLAEHALLTLDSLASLAERLPECSIEYNRGDLPIGVDGKPGGTGLSIGETIRHIARSNSWAVLKNVEQAPEYEALLLALLGEILPGIEGKTGAMLRPQAFVFISSPNAVTPYHFDPEHNILLQLVGRKTMTQFPAGDANFAPDTIHESYHAGGARELTWRDELAASGREFALGPGEAVYVPVMAPHFVRNGPESSIA